MKNVLPLFKETTKRKGRVAHELNHLPFHPESVQSTRRMQMKTKSRTAHAPPRPSGVDVMHTYSSVAARLAAESQSDRKEPSECTSSK